LPKKFRTSLFNAPPRRDFIDENGGGAGGKALQGVNQESAKAAPASYSDRFEAALALAKRWRNRH
jgi:hypothetical protein